jgi:GNAT superfamily N-acetyltransferase
MNVVVREISTKRDLRRFIDFQWTLYRDDPHWVPPLKNDIYKIITGQGNPLLKAGPHAVFLAEDEQGRVVGRIMTAIDGPLNKERGHNWGYFCLFESINDQNVANALLGAAEQWCKNNGCDTCRGPVTPDNGDDYRGLLIEGFNIQPVLMDSYNPEYYVSLMDNAGYAGDGDDRLAYYFDVDADVQAKYAHVIDYAVSRYGYHVDKVNLKNIREEFKDLKKIVDVTMPEWFDMIPPTMEEIMDEANTILPVADPDFILFARTNEGEPVGFVLGMPDYNQALKHVNGSMFPFGWAKFLWYRRRINALRIFVLFVTPEYQKKAVSHALFLESFRACKRRGYKWVEGSTILSSNVPMNRDAVGAGGQVYKKFRTYEKKI